MYAASLADAADVKTPAGTFAAGDDGRATMEAPCALTLDEATRIWITDAAGSTVLASAVP